MVENILTDNSTLEALLNNLKANPNVVPYIENELKGDKTFLVPVTDSVKLENGGSSIQFIFIERNEGVYVIAFTSEDEMQLGMEEGSKFIVLSLAEIVALVNQQSQVAGVYINPFSSMYRIPDTITGKVNDGQVMIGEPTMYPTKILNNLCDIFERGFNIESAWLSIMQQGYSDPELLLVLKGNYDANTLYPIIKEEVIPKLQELEGVGMAVIDANDEFGYKIASKYRPFWTNEGKRNLPLINNEI